MLVTPRQQGQNAGGTAAASRTRRASPRCQAAELATAGQQCCGEKGPACLSDRRTASATTSSSRVVGGAAVRGLQHTMVSASMLQGGTGVEPKGGRQRAQWQLWVAAAAVACMQLQPACYPSIPFRHPSPPLLTASPRCRCAPQPAARTAPPLHPALQQWDWFPRFFSYLVGNQKGASGLKASARSHTIRQATLPSTQSPVQVEVPSKSRYRPSRFLHALSSLAKPP